MSELTEPQLRALKTSGPSLGDDLGQQKNAAERVPHSVTPPYIQCVCPKHGPTTHLHADLERDDFCLLLTTPPPSDRGREVLADHA